MYEEEMGEKKEEEVDEEEEDSKSIQWKKLMNKGLDSLTFHPNPSSNVPCCRFLVLSDITCGMDHPCLMDIKV